MGLFLRFMPKILILVLALMTSTAHADCGLSLSTSNVSFNWDLSFTSLSVQIVVNKANAEACDFGIGITKGGGASYAGRRATSGAKAISYQLYSDNTFTKVIKDVPDITSAADVIQGGFGVGTNLTQTLLYYVVIPFNAGGGQSLYPAGNFTDTYQVKLYLGSDPLAFVTPVSSVGITIAPTVLPMIALSLTNSGGSFQSGSISRNINFGLMYGGETSAFDMFIRTNAGFSVTFSSTNNGVLKKAVPGGTSSVPYRFYVNNTLLNLSGSAGAPVVGVSGGGQTSTSGLAYPIRAVVGSTAGASLSGTHSDVITVTATTTE